MSTAPSMSQAILLWLARRIIDNDPPSPDECAMKHAPRLLLIAVCALTATMPTGAQSGWTSIWNGMNLDGWTTWMRQPEATSEVPGLARGADGKYTDPIGSGRDPLNVFTVAPDVDG